MKNAVVTGANRGLGLEMCKQLSEGDDYTSVYALCRKTSDELTALASASSSKVKIVENIELTKDDAITAIQEAFQATSSSPLPIHLLVHNAGVYGTSAKDLEGVSTFATQTLAGITPDRIRLAFEVNALAPLMITKALLPNLEAAAAATATSDGPAKVVIISSAAGSIEETTSGGHYAYRASKAAVNMVGKTLSVDLKEKNIAVSLVHPGFVYTEFIGKHAARIPGQRDVDESTRGILEAMEKTTMETTGSFYHGNYGEGVETVPW